jgi:23S rRNA pseudouridine955/2504/2580 synthase
MIQVTVPKDIPGVRLDKFLKEQFPNLPRGMIFKALRKKDILVNGRRVTENVVLSGGDIIAVYIPAHYLAVAGTPLHNDLDIHYEDENLLIVHKPPGLSVHPDRKSERNTLIQKVARYLADKGEAPEDPSLPALCHRLDHHTGGLIIIARTISARDFILTMIKERQIRKFYMALVKGLPNPSSGQVVHYFAKDARLSRVTVLDQPAKGALTAVTRYKTVRSGSKISLLEVELLTGRTHQIRAHMAHLGHPILGDDKYGDRKLNRIYQIKTQQLYAHRIIFSFQAEGPFRYLSGKDFSLSPTPFTDLDLEQIPLQSLDR